MIVVKLADGSLWVNSPVSVAPEKHIAKRRLCTAPSETALVDRRVCGGGSAPYMLDIGAWHRRSWHALHERGHRGLELGHWSLPPQGTGSVGSRRAFSIRHDISLYDVHLMLYYHSFTDRLTSRIKRSARDEMALSITLWPFWANEFVARK
jgi:hypothetical protein